MAERDAGVRTDGAACIGGRNVSGCGGARQGDVTDGPACKSGRKGLRPGATQAGPRRSRPSGGGCCLATCHSLRRPIPLSRPTAPLHTQTDTHDGVEPQRRQRCAAARARRAKPGANGGAKAKQSDCRGREDYGRGWAGRMQLNQPPPLAHHNAPHPTRGSASPQGAARRQRRRQGRAKATAAAGRTTGGGGRVGCNKTKPRHTLLPPPHPRQRNPAAQPTAKTKQRDCRGREPT